MSYVKIWIHAVFSIKDRTLQTLDKKERDTLNEHIRQHNAAKKIYIDSIDGASDHLHVLISLGKQQTIADIMQSIKGESSFWANKQSLFRHKLEWQDDYFAVSVSESQVEKVRAYISAQEEHHRKKSFAEEIEEFMIKYGWTRFKDDE